MRLSCLDDDAQGEPLAVLWESEIDARILDSDAVWKEVASRGFDRPELFAAYLDTLRWHGVTATNPKLCASTASTCRRVPSCTYSVLSATSSAPTPTAM